MSPIILDVECIVCNKTLHKISHDPREALQRMGKITNRRSRTPNWSLEEKQYLLELIRHRKEVVVTKSNNGPNHYEEKDLAWNEILRELAARFGSKFSESSIKKVKTQWQNMKRIAREEITANGPSLDKFTRQSVEVCQLLDMVQDGELKSDVLENCEPSIATSIEVKAEREDDDIIQPSCSDNLNKQSTLSRELEKTQYDVQQSVPSSPASEPVLEIIDNDTEDTSPEVIEMQNTKACMTDDICMRETINLNPFHHELQEYLKYTAAEKHLKMESLKEERQVIRAMRETAELNKIIAEQRLKQVLWLKKQEMAMYSGEPGSGAGKGGGGGGSIREAGGAFGKMEAAREDEYFYKKQKEQLQNLKSHLTEEITFHQEQIKRHEDAIRREKEKIKDIESAKK